MKRLYFLILFTAVLPGLAFAEEKKPAKPTKKKEQAAKAEPKPAAKKKVIDVTKHEWLNPLPQKFIRPGLIHHGFYSEANKTVIGYCAYLPPGYDAPENEERRYPVVYVLHGGRPGNENKLLGILDEVAPAMESGEIPPMIYVFANGGAMSHYDYPQLASYGERAFVNELIPQIDANYRTFKKREGRALEGGSQGGRGTARYMFKHPHLFISAAPMFGGHQHEKTASENNGAESEKVVFEPGNNTWDLAEEYAKNPVTPLHVLVVVGDQDFNYEANVEWMAHLEALDIPFEKCIVKDAPHSSKIVYEKAGTDIMKFHVENFKKALGGEW